MNTRALFACLAAFSIAALVATGAIASPKHGTTPPGELTVASWFAFPEGPVLSKNGKTLYCVNVQQAYISRVDLRSGTLDLKWVILPGTGRGNGATMGPDGALYVADVGRRQIDRVDTKTGAVTDYAVANEAGKPMLGPNDCVFDSDGGLYFTDPNGSSIENPIGAVYYVEPGTRLVHRVASGLAYPNGLAVSRDGKTLYVDESPRKSISSIAILGPLKWSLPAPFAQVGINGGPDGMRAAPDGTLYVASYGDGAIYHIAADGHELGVIPIKAGKNTTNLCIGDGGNSLYVTETQSNTIVKVPL